MTFYLLGIAAGFIMPVQTCMNTKLSKKAGSSLISSLVSFLWGTAILFVYLLCTQKNLDLGFAELAKGPWWGWTGGFWGVACVVTVILLNSELGVVQSIILPILGQIVSGLIIDGTGLFGATKIHVGLFKILGALLVFAGVVVISVSGGSKTNKSKYSIRMLLFQIMGIMSGMCSSIQTAINSHVGIVVQSSIKSTALSFFTGTAAVFILCIPALIRKASGKLESQEKGKWWMWFGGIIGFIYVYTSVLLAGKVGTALTVILMLSGTTAGGVLIDNFGLFDSPKKKITIQKIIGLLVLFAGVSINALL